MSAAGDARAPAAVPRTPRRRLLRRLTPRSVLLTAPSLLVLVALFLVPFGLFFAISFWRARRFEMQPDFTLHNYAEVGGYFDIILFTVGIGATISLIATTLAFSFAYVVRFAAGRLGPLLLFVVMVTMFGGYLVKIYAWKTILGSEGVLVSLLRALGVVDEPLRLFIYNPGAVVIALTHFLLPLAALPIYASLRGINDATIESARDLGAPPIQRLRTVVLPQCRQGLLVSLVFCFIVAAGDFVTPLFVGGPHAAMIGVFIHSQFAVRFNWPLGSAMAFSALFASVLVILIAQLGVSRLRPRW